MATAAIQPAKTKQMVRRERGMFSASDDTAMMKQIQATHAPDGRELEVKPILHIIEAILHHVSPGIDGDDDALKKKAAIAGTEGVLEELDDILQNVSCELSCKRSEGGDAAHAATMVILNKLSGYTWDAKLVASLASFSVNYGEFWLSAKPFATNPLAESIAVVKRLPDITENSNELKSRFNMINNLIKLMLDVTKSTVELITGLPREYINDVTPVMVIALADIPKAVYWTIKSMVACASSIKSPLDMNYDTMEIKLSGLAGRLSGIHSSLQEWLANCNKHIGEKKQLEHRQKLIKILETPHGDNLSVLGALFCMKDNIPPLVHGFTKKMGNVEVLRRKTVLLLISDLDLSHEELSVLTRIYQEARSRPEFNYEIVWLPIVDRSVPWNETYEQKFKQLQSLMPWYTLYLPSLLEPVVAKYIKEEWYFEEKLVIVVLDPVGKVACPNALHMVRIWGNQAYPFTLLEEESLWEKETSWLELLVDGIDQAIIDWIVKEKFICLYGGENIEWIRQFTAAAQRVATAAGISLEMVYVGKSSSKERVRKFNDIITKEQLSNCWNDPTYVWYFWTRVESVVSSKMQHGWTAQNDKIMQEVQTILTFNGNDQGWALISRGSAEMARATVDKMCTSLIDFSNWEKDAKEKGFIPALNEYLQSLRTAEHCIHLILPGTAGVIPTLVVCSECGRQMEMFAMYRCCTEEIHVP